MLKLKRILIFILVMVSIMQTMAIGSKISFQDDFEKGMFEGDRRLFPFKEFS